MAQRLQVRYIDDLDGGEADETIHFGLDGASFEIDVSAAHAADLRSMLEPYIAASRRAVGQARRGGRHSGRPAASRRRTQDLRERARVAGLAVKDRGRIPAEIVAQLEAPAADSAQDQAPGSEREFSTGPEADGQQEE